MFGPLPVEITLLGWSVILLVIHVAWQIGFAMPRRGFKWNAGPRDEGASPLGRFPGRAQRALDNFKETYPAFVALALALAAVGRTGGLGEIGATIWFSARVVYLPLYLLGVPWLRSIAFGASLAGLLLMLMRLF